MRVIPYAIYTLMEESVGLHYCRQEFEEKRAVKGNSDLREEQHGNAASSPQIRLGPSSGAHCSMMVQCIKVLMMRSDPGQSKSGIIIGPVQFESATSTRTVVPRERS